MSPRNGERDYPDSLGEEWIELERLLEIVDEIERLGGRKITPVDLLNRLGITDEEVTTLIAARKIAASSGKPPFLPGAFDPHEPGRRTARRPEDPDARDNRAIARIVEERDASRRNEEFIDLDELAREPGLLKED